MDWEVEHLLILALQLRLWWPPSSIRVSSFVKFPCLRLISILMAGERRQFTTKRSNGWTTHDNMLWVGLYFVHFGSDHRSKWKTGQSVSLWLFEAIAWCNPHKILMCLQQFKWNDRKNLLLKNLKIFLLLSLILHVVGAPPSSLCFASSCAVNNPLLVPPIVATTFRCHRRRECVSVFVFFVLMLCVTLHLKDWNVIYYIV